MPYKNPADDAACLLSQMCADCGESDPVVLEFDHVDRSTKSFNIGDAIHKGYSLDRIRAEIALCEIRCANCHRRKTAVDFGWYSKSNH